MMSTTYNNLMGDTRRTQGEWRVEFGDHLLHYERFLIIPPPFNLIQFGLFLIVAIFRHQNEEYREFLFGDWNSRERAIGRLYREKFKNVTHSQFEKKRQMKIIANQIALKEESIWQTIKKLIQIYGEDTKPTDIEKSKDQNIDPFDPPDGGDPKDPPDDDPGDDSDDDPLLRVPTDERTGRSRQKSPRPLKGSQKIQFDEPQDDSPDFSPERGTKPQEIEFSPEREQKKEKDEESEEKSSGGFSPDASPREKPPPSRKEKDESEAKSSGEFSPDNSPREKPPPGRKEKEEEEKSEEDYSPEPIRKDKPDTEEKPKKSSSSEEYS